MDNPLVAALALTSLVLGVAAIALLVYMATPSRRRRRKESTSNHEETAAPHKTPAAESAPVQEGDSSKAAKRPAKGKQHSLFVIFSQPDEATDQRLAEWLKEKQATFDPVKKVFHIAGEQPSNPITIANAFPPGDMPDLINGEVHQPIKGISLLVKPPLRKRRNQQMVVYVALAKEMGEIFEGDMLDGDRDPATEETYAHIIG
jgi:FtsZ-interacting cell division protein ZipA